jgi:ribonuclease HI
MEKKLLEEKSNKFIETKQINNTDLLLFMDLFNSIFLGIIQGLQYLREQGLAMPLYSDSYNAQVWVKRKAHKSSAKRSAELTKLLDEGIRYLTETPNKGPGVYVNIVDWKTSEWGEIPADFGRK